ncbi:hypothetical protein ACJRO7_030193 [Eucalyptus globulus]|uniref:Uncharacterized protein n=2 Tax=Eucalyptus globulus TaxID=34317 RepID=A0ABD3JGN9_EUCGL
MLSKYYSVCKMAGVKRRAYKDSDIRAIHKELDEVSCPICMDHPHNAVLLQCSSHEKGCRSYICDTSYRHSNCLDRFKKLRVNSRCSPTLPNTLPRNADHSNDTSGRISSNNAIHFNDIDNTNGNHSATVSGSLEGHGDDNNGENHIQNNVASVEVEMEGDLENGNVESLQERPDLQVANGEDSTESKVDMQCPLCRGAILGWDVVEEARRYLNLKKRSCSREACSYQGNYQELRRHARRVHPAIRPSDIDPSRERAWRRLEHQREYGDIVSAIRSAMPGAIVVGDYVIENGDRYAVDRENGSGEVNGPWWTTFFLFQMIGSMDSSGEPRSRARAWMRHRRPGGSERRLLWGENLLGLQDDDEDDDDDDSDDGIHVLSDGGEDASPIPRRRRRLMRSRSDEDRS